MGKKYIHICVCVCVKAAFSDLGQITFTLIFLRSSQLHSVLFH